MPYGYTKVCFWEGTKFISAELIEDRELEDKVLYWTDNPQLPNYETKDIKLDKPMISDEQYYREKEFEKKGFWNGVKITLMVVGILLALVFSLL